MQTSETETVSPPSVTPDGHARRSVVILNQAFYPDVVSTAQHATDLALGLVDAGFMVHVVTGARGYDDHTLRFPDRENYRGIDIIRIGSTSFGKASKWRRAADFASFLLLCAARIATLPHADLVIALTSPPLISVLASFMLPWKANAMLFWSMDLNPDEAIAAGWLKPRSLAGRVLGALQLHSMKKAGRIVALDRFMRDRLLAKGIADSKITVVPPWTHEGVDFDASGRAAFRREHGLDERFVIMYSGNHSPCHPLDTLLGAAERLVSDPRYVFCFIGGGSEYRRLKTVANERHLQNIRFLPYQPLERIGASLSAADLHVVVMGNGFVGIIHPCKIYNVLRVGAPVLYIGPEESHIADLSAALERTSGVFSARHDDLEAVVSAIMTASTTPHLADSSHIHLAEKFSPHQLVPAMVREVERLCGVSALPGGNAL